MRRGGDFDVQVMYLPCYHPHQSPKDSRVTLECSRARGGGGGVLVCEGGRWWESLGFDARQQISVRRHAYAVSDVFPCCPQGWWGRWYGLVDWPSLHSPKL